MDTFNSLPWNIILIPCLIRYPGRIYRCAQCPSTIHKTMGICYSPFPLIPSIHMDLRSTLMPMKLVEDADEILHHAEILFRDHQSIMRHDDRILAEDQIVNAWDHRHGVEQRRWPARAGQARLYFEHAQVALNTVKDAVERAIEIRSRRGGFYR